MPDPKQITVMSLITAFGFIVSLLYLFGYWTSFGINILEYASFSDILKLALYPLMIGTVSTLAGVIGGPLAVNMEAVRTGNKEAVFLQASRRLRWFINAFLILMGTASIILFPIGYKWRFGGLVVAAFLAGATFRKLNH